MEIYVSVDVLNYLNKIKSQLDTTGSIGVFWGYKETEKVLMPFIGGGSEIAAPYVKNFTYKENLFRFEVPIINGDEDCNIFIYFDDGDRGQLKWHKVVSIAEFDSRNVLKVT